MIQNPVVWRLMISFLIMTSVISLIACYFAHQQKRSELLAELDMQLLRVANEYHSITEDFWAMYLPVFEETEDNVLLTDYFSVRDTQELLPMEKLQLAKALSHIAVRNGSVQWIAVYAPDREKNYVYFPLGNTLQELSQDFPYLDGLQHKSKQMEIYPKEDINIGAHHYSSIAIAGGTPTKSSYGSIIMGYDVSQLQQLCAMDGALKTLHFDIRTGDKIIYSSGEASGWSIEACNPDRSGTYTVNGEKWYVRILDENVKGGRISYAVKWSELVRSASQNITMILAVTLLMAVLAVGIYFLTLRSLTREVNVIRDGLDILGQNQLNYRIHEKFNQPELAAIADAINQMTASLQDNIERTHEYEQRQIKSELQELQAKFNPHFLYNTLEIFRARCYQNGDDETAELIAQTAAIFRGFIGSRTFIPIQEELAFGKRYMVLFKARYGDSVKVLYDIDTEVLQYGIIRNVFQPLIENYFEHGYNPSNEENYIMFRGRIRDAQTIVFTIEDNGFGMEEEALQKLNAQLQQPISSEKESYGLKNLHQRLRLFYGGECGITLYGKEKPGLMIDMIIKRQKCEEDI